MNKPLNQSYCYYNPQCTITAILSGFVYRVLPNIVDECKYSTPWL